MEDIRDKRRGQRHIALTYGTLLRHNAAIEWTTVNAAIKRRWPRGLVRVKTMAWKFAGGGSDERP